MTRETPKPPSDEKPSDHAQKQIKDGAVPAHSTPEEKERLKDFNKDGIPPGAC